MLNKKNWDEFGEYDARRGIASPVKEANVVGKGWQ